MVAAGAAADKTERHAGRAGSRKAGLPDPADLQSPQSKRRLEEELSKLATNRETRQVRPSFLPLPVYRCCNDLNENFENPCCNDFFCDKFSLSQSCVGGDDFSCGQSASSSKAGSQVTSPQKKAPSRSKTQSKPASKQPSKPASKVPSKMASPAKASAKVSVLLLVIHLPLYKKIVAAMIFLF